MDEHAVIVTITTEQIRKALNLRTAGTLITAISYDPIAHAVTIRVDHPDLPAVLDDDQPVRADVSSFHIRKLQNEA